MKSIDSAKKKEKNPLYIFTIDGRVMSKKNSKRMFLNKKTGRRIIAPSKAYDDFKYSALLQLNMQKRRLKITEPLPVPYRVNIIFCMAGKMTTDKDNMEASIYDVLQDAGIISNDKYVMQGTEIKVQGFNYFQTFIYISKAVQYTKDDLPNIHNLFIK